MVVLAASTVAPAIMVALILAGLVAVQVVILVVPPAGGLVAILRRRAGEELHLPVHILPVRRHILPTLVLLAFHPWPRPHGVLVNLVFMVLPVMGSRADHLRGIRDL